MYSVFIFINVVKNISVSEQGFFPTFIRYKIIYRMQNTLHCHNRAPFNILHRWAMVTTVITVPLLSLVKGA